MLLRISALTLCSGASSGFQRGFRLAFFLHGGLTDIDIETVSH